MKDESTTLLSDYIKPGFLIILHMNVYNSRGIYRTHLYMFIDDKRMLYNGQIFKRDENKRRKLERNLARWIAPSHNSVWLPLEFPYAEPRAFVDSFRVTEEGGNYVVIENYIRTEIVI